MKDHLRGTPARSKSNKSSFAPDETVLPIKKTDSVGPPPPLKRAARTPAPTAKEADASLSTATLIPAIAAKAGISITNTRIDTSFIRKVEGSLLKAYVPLAGSTHSGPTVGDGFDLGQMHLAEFDKLPIEAGLKAKLRPYVGMTSFRAKNFLKSHPLTITPAELKQLNVVAADKILKPLMKTYNKASGKSFLELPPKRRPRFSLTLIRMAPVSCTARQINSCGSTSSLKTGKRPAQPSGGTKCTPPGVSRKRISSITLAKRQSLPFLNIGR